MKKILIQLDSDKFASTFDCIVAYDAGADVVQNYAAVVPADVRNLVLSAFFTRGISDLKNLAVWIGGSDVEIGEKMLAEACRTFFGPFKISVMLDSNGCNTTACTAIAKLARQVDLSGKTAFILGPGPVGLRAASLLAREGCRVSLSSIPPQLLGARFDPQLAARTLESGRRASLGFQSSPAASGGGRFEVVDTTDLEGLEKCLGEAEILIAAGPAGLRLIPSAAWASRPRLKWLLDFNLTEPLGIEGLKPSDDFSAYGDKRALGALAIGNPKMTVHKACITGLFERNDLVLDLEGVYRIARQLV
jgi:methylenetetrahydrofolate/methylenetetrahydromethanopterin dehydrogenase (NADP+)